MRSLMTLCLSVLAVACSGIRTTDTGQQYELQSRTSGVTIDDGISASEANDIANGYVLAYMSGCGLAGGITDSGEFWTLRTAIGVGGLPSDDIKISKSTGEVSSKNGPTIVDPRQIDVLPPNKSLERGRDG